MNKEPKWKFGKEEYPEYKSRLDACKEEKDEEKPQKTQIRRTQRFVGWA